jgi:hypothetical protein
MKPMPKILLLAAVFVAAVVTASAADVSGTWNVDGDVYGNAVKFSCAMKQDGEKLSGTATLEGGKDVPVTGTVQEKVVTFEYDVEHQGSSYHLVFTGTLGEEGDLKGKIAVAGAEGTFKAKKQ